MWYCRTPQNTSLIYESAGNDVKEYDMYYLQSHSVSNNCGVVEDGYECVDQVTIKEFAVKYTAYQIF